MGATQTRAKPSVGVRANATHLGSLVFVTVELEGLDAATRKLSTFRNAMERFERKAQAVRGVSGLRDKEVVKYAKHPGDNRRDIYTWHFEIQPSLGRHVVDHLADIAVSVFRGALSR